MKFGQRGHWYANCLDSCSLCPQKAQAEKIEKNSGWNTLSRCGGEFQDGHGSSFPQLKKMPSTSKRYSSMTGRIRPELIVHKPPRIRVVSPDEPTPLGFELSQIIGT